MPSSWRVRIDIMAIDFNYEKKLSKKYGYRYIVGLDEVGRGPLAGPVTVGAFIFIDKKLTQEPLGFLCELVCLKYL